MKTSLLFAFLMLPAALPVAAAPLPFHPPSFSQSAASGSPADSGTPADMVEPAVSARPWHTSVALRADFGGVDAVGRAAALELARADAGWGNWPGVDELLGNADWLDEEGAGEGWFLLGRAAEASEDWDRASRAFAAYLSGGATDTETALRLITALAQLGRTTDVLTELAAVREARSAFLSSWVGLEVARTLSLHGDTAGVRRVTEGLTDEEARDRARLLLPEAYLVARDSAEAEEWLRKLIPEVRDDRRRSRGWVTLAELRLASENELGARDAFRAALGAAENGRSATRAASGLIHLGGATTSDLPNLARILARGGDATGALAAYDRYMAEIDSAPPVEIRLARARLLAGSSRLSEAARELSELAESMDPAVGAPSLRELVRVQRRLGQGGSARATQDRLVARFPESAEAVDIVFFRADAQQDAGLIAEAAATYAKAVSMAPSLNRAGQSRMRLGQLRLTQADHAAAVEVYEGYLTEFPEGRRWQEAAYWAASSLLVGGEPERAARHVSRIRADDPFSYYAFAGAELLGEVHRPELEEEDELIGTEPDLRWMEGPLEDIDLLGRARGLEEAVAEAVDRLAARARASTSDLLSLAEALIEREMPIRGINLGWEARREGHPWTGRLARVIYPFPYRDLIVEEAREREVDPFLMAGLIRQESAFKADIVSSAGAVGLMQVMPATGRELARAVGPRGFREELLSTAEVNLHLGSRFLVDMLHRYDGRLTLVLSAYNAGPSRANRWRQLPEASDPARFTERIPFAETRGYVKNVTRNVQVYRWLYGVEE